MNNNDLNFVQISADVIFEYDHHIFSDIDRPKLYLFQKCEWQRLKILSGLWGIKQKIQTFYAKRMHENRICGTKF